MMMMLKKKIMNSKSKIICYFNLNDVILNQKVNYFYCLFLLLNCITQTLYHSCNSLTLRLTVSLLRTYVQSD